MGAGHDHAALFNRFCLGELPAEERALLEERLFLEDGVNEEFQAACDELILSYLTGALRGEPRKQFESFFLATPLRRERVEFVRRLLVEGRRPARQAARQRWWLAVAASVVAAGGLTLALHLRANARRGQPIAHSSQPTLAPDDRPPAVKRPVVALLLPADPQAPVALTVYADARSVRLEVPVAEAPSYSATIRSAAGDDVWRSGELDPPGSGARLALAIPADVLPAGDYSLLVEGESLRGQLGVASALRYSLRVRRER